MIDLKNQTVVVTGGTKGIGLEICRKFFEAGANVIVGARNSTNKLKTIVPQAVFKETDVRNYAEVEKLVEYALEVTGNFNVMINNAGISIWRSIKKVDEDFWSRIIDTNLKGCYWGCKAAAKYFRQGGTIINLGSLAGKRGSKNNSVYCASKFGVVGITQALAKELGSRNIRVNSVCPVYIKTEELVRNLGGDHPDIGTEQADEFLKKFGRNNAALKRIPTAEEVANTCLYLASSLASAITGQNINVDCGVLPQ